MPTTTWAVARADILRPLGFVSTATTTNITTNTSVVSTNLADDYTTDDFFNGWWIQILNDSDGSTSSNTGKIRRVTDYTASSGTLTVSGANLSAEDEAVDFILSRFNPARVQDYFNRARQYPELYGVSSIIRDIQTAVSGQHQHTFTLPTTIRSKPLQVYLGYRVDADSIAENEVTDPSFEDWSSTTALNSWSASGTNVTVTQESYSTNPNNYQVLTDQYSARLLSASSGAGTLLQTVTPTVGVESVEANFSVWVYATTASRVSARCGSTDGNTHTGTGWELLTASEVMGATDTTVSVGVSVSAGTVIVCYVDEATLIMGQTEPVDEPWEPLLNWRWVGPVAGASNGGTLEFPYDIPEQRRIRVIARDVLSSVSADTDTVELDTHRLEPLYAKTRELLAAEAKMTGPVDQRNFWTAVEREFRRDYQEALAGGILSGLPNPHVQPPVWSPH